MIKESLIKVLFNKGIYYIIKVYNKGNTFKVYNKGPLLKVYKFLY